MLGTGIFAIVGVLALIAMLITYSNAEIYTVYQTYEQPSNNKPAFLQTSKYLDNFDLCQQYPCRYPAAAGDAFGETEPAFSIGSDALTGNLRCGCSDGRTFLVRPDRLREGYE
jgi:hypothetical protein